MKPSPETIETEAAVPQKRTAADILSVVSNSLEENRDAELIRKATAALIADMTEAAREANVIEGEPIVPLLDALQRAVAWMGELSARNAQATAEQSAKIVRTVADVRRIAEAEIERERAAISADKAGIIRELSAAIATSTRDTQQSMVRSASRRSWVVSVGGSVLALVLVGGGGFMLGRQQGAATAYETDANLRAVLRVNPTKAPLWLNLMASNDPAQALAGCQGAAVHTYDGRRACEVPIWLDPPKAFRSPPAP